MIEMTIIKCLAITGLILANITLTIITSMLLDEYLDWKGNKNE